MSLLTNIEDLSLNIQRLKCCSSNKTNFLVTNKLYSNKNYKDVFNDILILNDTIELLLKYNTTENSINCLSKTEFNKIYNRAITYCELCNCE
jgi:hypothetical protein